MDFLSVNKTHLTLLFNWLDAPHVKAFWDNSPEHRDDIIHFADGRKTPSTYFGGAFSYWIGFVEKNAFCLIMTSLLQPLDDLPTLWIDHLADSGHTYSLDFCIGNIDYLGKRKAAPTLQAFMRFFQQTVDPHAVRFLIDPDAENTRAIKAYASAGFSPVGDFEMPKGYFAGQKTLLMTHDVALRDE